MRDSAANAPNDGVKQARRFVAHLQQLGLRWAVISPGMRSAPLVLALAEQPAISTLSILDERAAAFVALGISRAQGRAAAFVCTSGSAAAHALPAVIEASESEVPLLLLTADRPPELQGLGAPQTVDQQRLYGVHARAFIDLGTPSPQTHQSLGTRAAQAWLWAHRRCGPVQINLPFREPLLSCGQAASSDPPPSPALLGGRVRADLAELAPLIVEMKRADRGVVVCGPLLQEGAAAADAIDALAATLDWPLIADPLSGLRYRPRRSAIVESADALLREATVAEELAPDFVLRFGRAPTSKALSQWLGQWGHHKTTLVSRTDRFDDHGFALRSFVQADIESFCGALVGRLDRAPRVDPNVYRQRFIARDRQARAALIREVECRLSEPAALRVALQRMPREGSLHVASSMPIRDLDTFGFSDGALLARVFGNRGANGIDGTVASAAGEAVGVGSPLLLILGDLAFAHDAGGLLAASQLDVDLTIVVIANGGGGIFELTPAVEQAPALFRRHFLAPQRLSIADLCRAADVSWRRADDLVALGEALDQAQRRSGVDVIELPVDRRESLDARRQAFARAARDCTRPLAELKRSKRLKRREVNA